MWNLRNKVRKKDQVQTNQSPPGPPSCGRGNWKVDAGRLEPQLEASNSHCTIMVHTSQTGWRSQQSVRTLGHIVETSLLHHDCSEPATDITPAKKAHTTTYNQQRQPGNRSFDPGHSYVCYLLHFTPTCAHLPPTSTQLLSQAFCPSMQPVFVIVTTTSGEHICFPWLFLFRRTVALSTADSLRQCPFQPPYRL